MRSSAGIVFTLVLLGGSANSQLPAIEPFEVGPHGDVRKLQIEGAEHFSADSIRQGLQRDSHVMLNSRRNGSLYEFRKAVERQVRGGYRLAGFADVEVDVFWKQDAECLTVQIVEGAQYKTGDLVVRGVNGELEGSIRRWLTEPHPPAEAIAHPTRLPDGTTGVEWTTKDGKATKLEEPLFAPGEVAKLSDANDKAMLTAVKRALAEHAYHHPTLQLHTAPIAASSTVGLEVIVEDLGKQARLEKIVLTGHARDAEADILKYLDLAPGQVATQQRLLEVWSRLWECGRYQHFEVEMHEPLVLTDPVELRIALREYPEAPPLVQSLSEIEHALLRTGEWLNRLPESTSDMLLELTVTPTPNSENGVKLVTASQPDEPAGSEAAVNTQAAANNAAETNAAETAQPWGVALAASGTRGLFVSLFGPHPLTNQPTRLTMIAEQRTLHLYHHTTRLHYALELSGTSRLMWRVEMRGLEEPKSDDYRVGTNFHLMTKNSPHAGESERIVSGTVSIAPMAALDLGRGRQLDNQPEPGQLTVVRDEVSMVIEKASGRFLDASGKVRTEGAAHEFSARPVENAIEHLRGKLLPDAQNYETVSDPAHRFSTLIQFVGRVIGEQRSSADSLKAQRTRALLSVLQQACARLEAHQQHELEDTGPEFKTPWTGAGQPSMSSSIAGLGLRLNNEVFARDTPAWRLGRELAALLAFQDRDAFRELQSLLAGDDAGPLLHLYAAEVMRWFHPPFATACAEAGLKRLDTQRARRDFEQMLHGGGAARNYASEIVLVLRGMSEQDLLVLLRGWLDEPAASRVAAVCHNGDLAPEEAAAEVFELLWPQQLSPRVKHRLEIIRGPIPVKAVQR